MPLQLEKLSASKKIVLAGLGLLSIGAPLAFGILRTIPAYGQILHASGPLPSFEVVSIRPWKPVASPPLPTSAATPRKVMKMSPVGGGGQVTDRIHLIEQAEILIASAYNMPIDSKNRILGGPDWLYRESERYEIAAKIGDATFAAMEKMAPAQQQQQIAWMEQSLLADRFALKMHFATKEMAVYALVPASGSGPKLKPAAEGEASELSNREDEQGVVMTARGVTIEELARSPLLWVGGRLVVDQTGLKGRYDFTLTWRNEQSSGAAQELDAPSIFTAMQEQLGLKLVPTKAPVEVIVIDSIERPSPN